MEISEKLIEKIKENPIEYLQTLENPKENADIIIYTIKNLLTVKQLRERNTRSIVASIVKKAEIDGKDLFDIDVCKTPEASVEDFRRLYLMWSNLEYATLYFDRNPAERFMELSNIPSTENEQEAYNELSDDEIDFMEGNYYNRLMTENIIELYRLGFEMRDIIYACGELEDYSSITRCYENGDISIKAIINGITGLYSNVYKQDLIYALATKALNKEDLEALLTLKERYTEKSIIEKFFEENSEGITVIQNKVKDLGVEISENIPRSLLRFNIWKKVIEENPFQIDNSTDRWGEDIEIFAQNNIANMINGGYIISSRTAPVLIRKYKQFQDDLIKNYALNYEDNNEQIAGLVFHELSEENALKALKISLAHGEFRSANLNYSREKFNELFNNAKQNGERVVDVLLKSKDITQIDKRLIELQEDGFCDPIYISKEDTKTIIEALLITDYKISESTPYFLRGNLEFISRYVSKNKSLDGLMPEEVAPLLLKANVKRFKDLPGFYEAAELIAPMVNTDLSKYINSWGAKNTLEIYERYGDLISTLSFEVKYTLETIREEFTNRVRNLAGIADNKIVEELQELVRYKPTKEELETNNYFKNSKSTMMLMLPEDPTIIKYYLGRDDSVYKYAIELGFTPTFEEYKTTPGFRSSDVILLELLKTIDDKEIIKEIILSHDFYWCQDEEIWNVLQEKHAFDFIDQIEDKAHFFAEHTNLSSSKNVISLLARVFDVNYIKYCTSSTDINDLIEDALNRGYIPKVDDLKENENLARNKKIIEAGLNGNPEKGIPGDQRFNIYYLCLNETKKDPIEIEKIFKNVIGEEEFIKIFNTPEKKEDLTFFAEIPGIGEYEFFEAFNSRLVNGLGYNEWKKILRYAFKNRYMGDLLELAKEEHMLKEFQDVVKTVGESIKDDKAEGINKFMYLAHAYRINPELLKSILLYTTSDQKLSDKQIQNLYTYIYSDYITDEDKRKIKNIDDLSNLIEIERQRNIEALRMPNTTSETIKSDMISFIFGMDLEEAKVFLGKDTHSNTLDTLIISRVIEQAQKSGNKNLELYAKSLFIPVDILEQIVNSNADKTSLVEMAMQLYKTPEKDVIELRKNFGNMFEKAREFYEYEINSELTNLDKVVENPNIVKYDGNGNKIIDLSNTKHMILASVMGMETPEEIIKKYFDFGAGRATICVSNESDLHEAYYYNNETAIRFGFTKVQNGGFIANNRSNAGSNGVIKNNDIDIKGISLLFKQTSSRTSFIEEKEDSGHSETLLFRAGLIPTCIVMVGDTPTDKELTAKKMLEEKIEQITGEKREIYLVKTQHSHKRVINYKDKGLENKPSIDIDGMKNAGEKVTIAYSAKEDNTLIRYNPTLRINYVTNGTKTFALHEGTERENASIIVASTVQEMVYGKDSENVLQYKVVKNQYGNDTIAIRVPSIVSLRTYSRKDEAPSLESKKIFLKEFLVDHLICNYNSGNLNFLMDTDGMVLGVNKDKALESAEFFKQDRPDKRGNKYYTAFSYNFYDGYTGGNNVYRKVFEDYINNPDSSQVFSKDDLKEFIQICDTIKQMPEDEYLKGFNAILSTYTGQERVQMTSFILERKRNVGQEAREFISNLVLQRKEKLTTKEYKSDTVAFITDIHGNAEALESLMQICEEQGKRDVFILGDTIGFGPQSNECIDIIKKYQKQGLNICALKGNHEMYCAMGDNSFESTGGFEKDLTDKTRKSLTPENRRFVENLPIQRQILVDGKKILLTHFPEAVDRPREREDSEIYVGHHEQLDLSKTGDKEVADLVVFGHEHHTESLEGDEIGKIHNSQNLSGIMYANLPSSGCVHGSNTSMTTIRVNSIGEIELQLEAVPFERKKLIEAVVQTNNPKANFFGITSSEMDAVKTENAINKE